MINSRRHNYNYVHSQKGLALLSLILLLGIVLGVALVAFYNVIAEERLALQNNTTDEKLQTVVDDTEAYYRHNPDFTAPGFAANVCSFALAVSPPFGCALSPTQFWGREGEVTFFNILIFEPNADLADNATVPVAAINGEQIQLNAQRNLREQLRRIVSVIEINHQQMHQINAGGHADTGVNLYCLNGNSQIGLLGCESDWTPLPAAFLSAYLAPGDQVSPFGTPIVYQTAGTVTLTDVIDNYTIRPNDSYDVVAAVVSATTPWDNNGVAFREWAVALKGNAYHDLAQ